MNKDKTLYTIKDAIDQIKSSSRESFDATVEVHINLERGTNNVRFPVTLPHGTGKEVKVAVMSSKKDEKADLQLNEADLKKIESGDIKPKVDFDILVVEPKYMPIIAKVAQILGPQGLMPNPKNGTVTDNIGDTIDSIKKGQIEVKQEKDAPIIHTTIGKKSFENKLLEDNLTELIKTLKQRKPTKAKPDWIKAIFISTTMGKSVKLDVNNI